MRYPQSLKEGGTIGFVAPSFGCATEPYKSAFQNAQKKLSALGYEIALGPNCYAGEGIGISNLPEKCAEELMEYYRSDENDVLISCGGGELMCEILPYLDFDGLSKANPKWFMGYSDNTNFAYLSVILCDTAAIYGPCAAAFGMEPWHPAIKDALSVLKGELRTLTGYDKWEKESLKTEENPFVPYNVTNERKIRVFGVDSKIGAELEGRLLGGCLDCLVTLAGTKFDKTVQFLERYRKDGIIWFLEACDLNVFAIRRAMWQLDQAGWFKTVKGFLIGRPRNGEELFGLDAYDAILEVASKYRVPVIMDLDIGHLPPMMPLIIGSYTKVEICGNDIVLTMIEK